MLGLRTSVLLLPLLLVTLWAAPLTKYDQRQDGDFNAQVHLENFVILLIPGGLRGFNIAGKVAPGKLHGGFKHARPNAVSHVHGHSHTPASSHAHAHAHGVKASPYHVDIDADRRAPPLVLEISPALPEDQHEVVIAESPTVVLAKKPAESAPAEEVPAEVEAEKEKEEEPQEPAATPAATDEAPAASPAEPSVVLLTSQNPEPKPTRIAEKPKKPIAPAPAPAIPATTPTVSDVPAIPAPTHIATPAAVPAAAPAPAASPVTIPAATNGDKNKRPVTSTVTDKPKRPAAPAADRPKRPSAPVPAAAPAVAPAAAPVPTEQEAAPVSEVDASDTPAAPASSSGDRAARVAALARGMESHPAAGTPCSHGGCLRDQDPVGVYEDHLLKALSFGLEPAH